MFKVLICGDRNWGDINPIKELIKRLAKKHGVNGLLVIHGKAPGADTMAGVAAKEASVHVAEVPALWDTRYRAAGPQRNQAMLALDPDLVVAFHPDLKSSKGTKDMVKRSRKAGVEVKVVES